MKLVYIMSSENDAVRRLVGPLRELFSHLEPSQVRVVNEFWGNVRTALQAQAEENSSLRQALQQSLQQQRAAVIPPAIRPDTANSVNQLRFLVDHDLQQLALSVGEDEASATVEKLVSVPFLWARAKLEERRIPVSHELGCWESAAAAAHNTGYVKVNLRNTPWPTGSGRQGFMEMNPFQHQLAIVGKGEAEKLLLTSKGEYHVSHLCHNPACFNPRHVIVEFEWLNALRNSCKNSYILEFPDGTVVNPCTHWKHGLQVHCILPKRKVTPEMVGRYLDMGNDGPVIRDGRSR